MHACMPYIVAKAMYARLHSFSRGATCVFQRQGKDIMCSLLSIFLCVKERERESVCIKSFECDEKRRADALTCVNGFTQVHTQSRSLAYLLY